MKKNSFIIILLLFGQLIKCQNWLGFGNLIPNSSYVQALYYSPSFNKLFITGPFTATVSNKQMRGITSYDGIVFDSVGCGVNLTTSVGRIMDITDYQGSLYVGGLFNNMGTKYCKGIAKWDGIKWDSLSSQINGVVDALKVFNNELYVSGYFFKAGNLNVRSIAKYSGSSWSNVGLGFPYNPSSLPDILCMEIYNNELYVGGTFLDSSNNMIGIAKYDGATWKKVGLTMYGGVTEILDLKVYNGSLYAAGRFKREEGNIGNAIIKYDGNTWSKVGESVTDQGNCLITKMKVINNKLYVVGGFKSIENTLNAGGMAIWNDTSWCVPPTGSQIYKASAIEYFQNKIYMGGAFYDIGNDTVPNLAVLNTTITACSAPVSVQEFGNNLLGIKIFPNPTQDFLNIEFLISERSLSAKLQVLNNLGQTVKEEEIYFENGKAKINVKQLSSGLYTVKVSDGKSQKTFKFLKTGM